MLHLQCHLWDLRPSLHPTGAGSSLGTKNLPNLSISKQIFYFVRWECGFHITLALGIFIPSFIPQNLPFVTLRRVNFILPSQVYLGNKGTITRKQRNNLIKWWNSFQNPIPEDHPVVLTVKGVQDELNPPGEKGFDILSHQLGRWQLSKFPDGFSLGLMW